MEGKRMIDQEQIEEPKCITTMETLREVFAQAKASQDWTRGMFEQEKTKRIMALCDVIKSGLGTNETRQMLLNVLNSEYKEYDPFRLHDRT